MLKFHIINVQTHNYEKVYTEFINTKIKNSVKANFNDELYNCFLRPKEKKALSETCFYILQIFIMPSSITVLSAHIPYLLEYPFLRDI